MFSEKSLDSEEHLFRGILLPAAPFQRMEINRSNKEGLPMPKHAGFSDWFQNVTGYAPYPYQTRFATDLVLPQLVDVPTGIGKTAMAVLGWLWRRRFHEDEAVRTATPRRLVYCLPMRVLVEQTKESAEKWIDTLVEANYIATDSAPAVYTLMGGETDLDWDSYPEADAILIGTQDQLLSRALNRGYSMSRYRWPMHFALMNNDCLWIMDEVQLMGAGLPTTAQLQAFREKLGTYGPAKSIWMSATLKSDALATIDFKEQSKRFQKLSLESEDRTNQAVVTRLNAQKLLAKAQTDWREENAQRYAKELSEEVYRHHQTGTLTLVVLNRVQRAQALFMALQQNIKRSESSPDLLLIHSRFRPSERQHQRERLKQIPPQGRIIVATQAIEAGIDLSARTLFTELAPWSSLVQRFGRCNRYGEYTQSNPACIFWIDLETMMADKKGERKPNLDAARPYRPDELDWAREQLMQLSDAGPKTVSSISDPHPVPFTHVLRRKDLIDLFDTTPDLVGNDIDVSRYIRESQDTDVQVYWRNLGGERPRSDEPAPKREELCSVSIGSIKTFLKKAKSAFRWDSLDQDWIPIMDTAVWPGLTILLDVTAGGYSEALGWTGVPTDRIEALPIPDTAPNDGNDRDDLTFINRFVTLMDHSKDIAETLDTLRTVFSSLLSDAPWDDLSKAARWHDLGKAHGEFQKMLLKRLDENDPKRCQGPWAKSAHQGGRHERPHFRHELASALALLQHKESDLAAYLAAAHHGKVRLSIRSLPGERPPDYGGRFARGIWEGDPLPSVDLGNGIQTQAITLNLTYMDMGEGPHGASWLERMIRLRDHYGPFRLAWLETLVRVADWRATRKEGELHE